MMEVFSFQWSVASLARDWREAGTGGDNTAVLGIWVGDGVISGASVPLTQGLAGGIRGFRGSGKRDRTCRGVAIRWWSC